MKCSAAGCSREAAAYGVLCKTHQSAKRRNGSPDQRPITKAELGAAKLKVQRLLDSRKNPELLREKLQQSLTQLITEAKADLSNRMKVPGGLARQQAAKNMLAICEEAESDEVVMTAVALAYMMASDRCRFVTDAAFFTLSGRRMRLLSKSAYTTSFNSKTATKSRTPKDVRPAVLMAIGQRFMEAFGSVGIALHGVEVREASRAKQNRTDILHLITDDEPEA